MKRNTILGLLAILLLMVTCGHDDSTSIPKAPTGLSTEVTSSGFYVTWNPVSNANYYEVYWSGDSEGPFYHKKDVYETRMFFEGDMYMPEDHYIKVKAVNDYGTSQFSACVYCHYSYGGGGGGGGSTTLDAPTNVSASVSGSSVSVTWNSVDNAEYYKIYRASSSDGFYSSIGTSYNTSYNDENPMSDNYYKVSSVGSIGDESDLSNYTYCQYSSGGGGGGGGATVPDAPTGVTTSNNGGVGETWVLISWNSVSNATSYKVFRCSSANGSYSQIGTTEFDSYNDKNPLNGDNYYKVKAVNSAGASGFSSYAYFNNAPIVHSPCPVNYTSHTATSTTITLKWKNPTTSGCGTPTKAYLRVKHPDSSTYVDLQTLSGTATSASFSYGMWANSEGYVYCGIITENSAGTSGGTPLVYNWKTNTWYGGKGIELEGFMEQNANGF